MDNLNISGLFCDYNFFLLFVAFCHVINTECIQNQTFYVGSVGQDSLTNSNKDDGRKYEQSQEIKRIRVDVIHKKLNLHTYIRELQFNAFHEQFRIFMRKNPLLENNLQLEVGNQILGTNVKKLTKYLPVLYVGIVINSSKSIVNGQITDTEFELFIKHRNETYSVNCTFEKQSVSRPDFENLKYSLKNCKAYKLKKERFSVMAFNGNRNVASIDYKDYIVPEIYGTDHDTLFRRPKRNTPTPVTGLCVLKLLADHSYFEDVGNNNVKTTVAEMLITLATTDTFFRQTDFDGDGEGDNIGFRVGNITIFSADQDYKMKNESTVMHAYLKKLSEYNFIDYCLGFAFSSRDFNGSTVGTAYVGKSSHYNVDGICPKRSFCKDGTCNSYNVGMLTLQNFGRFISSESAAFIMAHEFGHSFGSSHDKSDDCTPGGDAGNYLMFPVIGDGNRVNHRFFSSCSIQMMYPVIFSKGPGCFKEEPNPICGNAILEEDEECDCGSASMCQEIDPCCTPGDSSVGTPCTFSILNECNPKESFCCTKQCNYFNESDQVTCQEETECSSRSVCRHGQSTCPAPQPRADGTPCAEGSKTCYRGVCTKSICTYLNLTDCQCTTPSTSACLVCCEETNESNPVCAPVNSYDSSIPNMNKQTGDPCFNDKGFCNHEMQCVVENEKTTTDVVIKTNICGNGILEENEECDCGSVSMCQETDQCCTPSNSSDGTPCTFSILNECNPKTSVCCTEMCSYFNESDQVTCQEETECSSRSVCRHGQSTCPDPQPQADGTPCDGGSKTCYRGVCTKSICTYLNLTDCQCTTPSTSACLVCCKSTNKSNPVCAPVNSYDSSIANMTKHTGDPCFNYKGFCNHEMKCVLETENNSTDDMLNTNILETAADIGTWSKKYWFYLILTIFVLVLVTLTLSAYFKPQQDIHMDAVRMGKLTAIVAQSQAQKQLYQEKIDDCKKAFQNIDQQETARHPIPLTLAIARMSLFFPTAPLSLIFKTVTSSSSEEFAVKMMLVRKYPMQTFMASLQENKSITFEPAEAHEDIDMIDIILEN